MLAFYQRWARRMYPARALFVVLFLLAVSAFGWLLFSATPEFAQRWQLTAVLCGVSSLLLWLWAVVFYPELPTADHNAATLHKIKIRLQRLCYYLLAMLVTVLLLATTYLGLRVLKGIIATLFFS
ncbi:hypothetical protein [Rheinheimera sp. EpRS3]|uniref:hypothetical protein n=1 Tax=Rheinheimera sp. EpRS3 TaxID=1712383 RepID=UPI000749DCA2|nr:hypothetical protein [Rheinheimera sp. EpRS3]KUM53694.1 hypothetical protein AR688_18690 [Rheinheimera sp. EpRS3]